MKKLFRKELAIRWNTKIHNWEKHNVWIATWTEKEDDTHKTAFAVSRYGIEKLTYDFIINYWI